MEIFLSIFLNILGLYFFLGAIFACYLMFFKATGLDAAIGNSKLRVRILLFPGVVATWPFLLGKFLKSNRK